MSTQHGSKQHGSTQSGDSDFAYLGEVSPLTGPERRAALRRDPENAEELTRRVYEVAREIRQRRPPEWRFAFGSQSSERLSAEVRAELEELLSAGDTPFVAAEKLDISYRAARRAKKKRERRVGHEWCDVCRSWVIAPCVACGVRGQAGGE